MKIEMYCVVKDGEVVPSVYKTLTVYGFKKRKDAVLFKGIKEKVIKIETEVKV